MADRREEINLRHSRTLVPLNTWVLISNFKLAYTLLRREDGTFNRHLSEFLDRTAPANVNPINGVFTFDILDPVTEYIHRIFHPVLPQPRIDMYRVVNTRKPLSDTKIVPVIVFFHGGSFAHSSPRTAIYDMFCRQLSRACEAVVVSVDYRRSPEHRYPCAYDDGWGALQWVMSKPWLQSGVEPKVHVYLAGDSSGGNIAHHVAVRAAEEGVEVMGNILLHPMFGGEGRTESEFLLDGKYFVTMQDRDWYWRAFLPIGENRDHPACNPFGPRGRSLARLKKFPRSLVVIAGFDLMQDWQMRYVEGLRNSGHEVKLLFLKEATIGFYLLPNNQNFYTLMDEMKDFVNPNLDR